MTAAIAQDARFKLRIEHPQTHNDRHSTAIETSNDSRAAEDGHDAPAVQPEKVPMRDARGPLFDS